MLINSMLMLATAALSMASPIARRQKSSCNISTPPYVADIPTLPVTGGDTELPRPAGNMTLKNILLGFGIQNYTCASGGADPTATGALAMLYDITPLYPGQSSSSLSQEAFDNLVSSALNNHELPINIIKPPQEGQLTPGADISAPFPDGAPLQLEGLEPIPFVGHHTFNNEGVPHFEYNDVDLLAKKLDAVDAPAGSDAGPDDTGAVAWLYLGADEGSVGAKAVYRVHTAGGNSHGCGGVGSDSTSYSTMYWFYN